MWRFQQNKKRQVNEGGEVKRPFMDSGLFRFCRHPNYFCEMGMWVVFYLFAILCISSVLALDGSGQRSVDIAFSRLHTTRREDIERKIPRLQQVPGHGTKVHSIYETGLYTRKITSSLRFFKGFKELLATPDVLR